MKKVRFMVVLMVIALMVGTAWADNVYKHVKVAPGTKGDLIIFPWYVALNGGWQTKITVVNTSDVYSTVAKVVLKSHVWSEELLDFLIFLSPNDVWTGYLVNDGAGTKVVSYDDSVLLNKALPAVGAAVVGDFASANTPFEARLFSTHCNGSAIYMDGNPSTADYPESGDIGYIEVIESRSASSGDPGVPNAALLAKVGNKVPKPSIFNWYFGSPAPTFPDSPPRNILAGFMEFSNKLSSGFTGNMTAEVFADWDNTAFLDTNDLSGLATNPSRNNIGELEAAMSKFDVSMPYVKTNGAMTMHVLNFPTKNSYIRHTGPTNGICGYVAWDRSPYYTALGNNRCESLNINSYDMQETSTGGSSTSGGDTNYPICNEVEILTGSLFMPYTEGWVRYNLAGGTTAKNITAFDTVTTGTYTGIPVLPSVLYFTAAGLSLDKAAFSDGTVTMPGTTDIYPYYQYYDPNPVEQVVYSVPAVPTAPNAANTTLP